MSADFAAGALIAVDWGTSNVRAALLDARGAIIDTIDSDRGISRLARGDFPATFVALLEPWLERLPEVPVLMAGMVGSADGWIEVPYLPCPASLDTLARHLVRVPGIDRWVAIVPGLAGCSVAGNPDVMRGEEVQIAGALQTIADDSAGIFCLPGTHSKWATVQGATVASFSTSMTGELYAALRDHSILGRGGGGNKHDGAAFESGLAQAARPGGLLHHLFSVRSEVLLGDLAASAAMAYLSGILVGHEVAAMLATIEAIQPITVVGDPALIGLYTHAIEYFGRQTNSVDGREAAWQGLFHLAGSAGHLHTP
jgi:2-dehydro-3-deoxygalactonokinase